MITLCLSMLPACFAIIIGFLSSSVLSTSHCMTVHRCLHGEAPRYVADLITPSAAATARAGLRPPRLALSECHVPMPCHHLATARSLWLLRMLGTIFRHHFVELIPLTLSDINSKYFSLLRFFIAFSKFFSNCIFLAALVVLAHLRRLRLHLLD